MKYHKHFKNINDVTVKRSKILLDGWSQKSEQQRWEAIRLWTIMVSVDRGMECPKLMINPSAGYGYYSQRHNEIHMSKPSIVTLFHEFRHAMQYQGKAGTWRDEEHDARGWSLSLYFKIAPRTLKRLVAEEKVLHMTVADFA
jgi:hypothetical protein